MNKPLSEELKPCPFCGGTSAFVERADCSSAFVICDSDVGDGCACYARGPIAVQDDDGEELPGGAGAIAAWNRRAPDAASSAPATEVNRQFTPMERRGTLVYLGRAGGFDVRDCPEPEALAEFIVRSCNAAPFAQQVASPTDDREAMRKVRDDAWTMTWFKAGYRAALAAQPAVASTGKTCELPELPDSLEDVRGKFRGEWDYVEAGDSYYTAEQMREYAKLALSTLAPSAEEPDTARLEHLFSMTPLATFCNVLDIELPPVTDFRPMGGWAREQLDASMKRTTTDNAKEA